MRKYINVVDRILSNCRARWSHICGSICYEWTLSVCNKGYGNLSQWDKTEKKRVYKRVHIFLWELVNGPVRGGYTLDHLCLNTRCIRPDHLEEVPRHVNTARGNQTRHGHAATA